MSVSVFEHPFLSGLFSDPEVQACFSAHSQIAHLLAFEQALSDAMLEVGLLSADQAKAACLAFDDFVPDMPDLAAGTARDGVVVPALVAQLRARCTTPEVLHRGVTSQDVIDTAQALGLRTVSEILCARLDKVLAGLADLEARFGARQIMGRTRMQAALPIPVSHRIESWRGPLERAVARGPSVTAQVAILSLGGPVGTGQGLEGKRDEIAARMANALDLTDPGRARHAERDGIVSYGDWLSQISGALGKMGQDIALMAQQGIDEIRLSSGGGSSAMAHKCNPVLAELLVTLARFNAAQVGALHGALVHEQERSGAAWALEWMILPQMAAASGRSLAAAEQLLTAIDEIAPWRAHA
jgi:3-carboxy-cis,cis-muconate cycloisomerase